MERLREWVWVGDGGGGEWGRVTTLKCDPG